MMWPVEGIRQTPLLGFGVVANVVGETAHGEGGLELRHGLRHFAAGARVWVLPVQWGDGSDQDIVAGHHRGTRAPGRDDIPCGSERLRSQQCVGAVQERDRSAVPGRPGRGRDFGVGGQDALDGPGRRITCGDGPGARRSWS